MAVPRKRTDLSGTRMAVIGLGRSGAAAARLASSLGADLFISEARPAGELTAEARDLIERHGGETGGHTAAISEYPVAVISPGVPPAAIRDTGFDGEVWSELELALRAAPWIRPISVTGTNGKSTTVSLIGRLIESTGRNVRVLGNIGRPLSADALEIGEGEIVVLEVSSYQLEATPSLDPSIGVILNIAPDHLDRYASVEEYAETKARLVGGLREDALAILNLDDPLAASFADRCGDARVIGISAGGTAPAAGDDPALRPEIRIQGGRIVSSRGILADLNGIEISPFQAPENLLAAVAAASEMGVPRPRIEEVLRDFKGLPHRLEFVGEWDGVRYYDDSKATNIHAVKRAVEGLDGGIILLLGGRAKGEDFADLVPFLKGKVRKVIAFGEAGRRVGEALAGKIPCEVVDTMAESVNAARNEAIYGTSVLLSPACSSFDEFKNYAERGDVFRRIVEDFAGGRG